MDSKTLKTAGQTLPALEVYVSNMSWIFKGSLTRDFRFQAFFINQFPLGFLGISLGRFTKTKMWISPLISVKIQNGILRGPGKTDT